MRRVLCGAPSFVRLGLVLLAFGAPAFGAQIVVPVGVLGLFHPRELVLEPVQGQVLSVAGNDDSKSQRIVLNGEDGYRSVLFRADGDRVTAGGIAAKSWTAAARGGEAGGFQLIVPGKLRRTYEGTLELTASQGVLIAVVVMDREIAVASIVGAEMDERAPSEALKAQAVVTRSFLAAGKRHLNFDFCDTTHCQFLKSPPEGTSRVRSAVEATSGMVIAWRGKPLAAMYSSRCGGMTRSLRDAGLDSAGDPDDAYPYYAVPCRWCHDHPLRWQHQLSAEQKPPRSGDERERVESARQWGWSALPGNDFTTTKNESGWKIEGHNLGHGIGMCQRGAIGMAKSGADFQAILSHYYPNTTTVVLH